MMRLPTLGSIAAAAIFYFLALSGCGGGGGGTVPATPVIGTPEAEMVGIWRTDLIPPPPEFREVAEGSVYEMILDHGANANRPWESNFMHGRFTSTMKKKLATEVAVAVIESLVEGLDVPSSFTTTIPPLKIEGRKATNVEPSPWGLPGVGMTVELDALDPNFVYFTLVTPQEGVVLNRVPFHRVR